MAEQQLEQIEGTVEDIIYENTDNGYMVFEVSGGGVVTVVCGIVGELHAGESVVCRGRYENHATYGRQFHAQECETDMPKDLEAVYAFLASRSLPYIGAKTADKIIDLFGAEALEVIANDPARLTQVPGISADKADRIQQEFKRMFGMRELIAYLAQFEISPRRAMEVFRTFGSGAMQAIAANPYLLCGEPLQLDFRHADSIAQYYHMEGDCAQRLEAALLRTLRHNAGNGHTCLPRTQLLETASNFIHQPPEKLAAALDECIRTEELRVKLFDGTPYIYLPDLLEAEEDIAARLAMLTKRGKNTAHGLDKNIQILELTQGFAYAPLQKEAIRKAMTENCLVLTGGPGTGKTTIINAIIRLFAEVNAKILLAAPTGRAAKRMSETSGREARTIHRLLEYSPQEDGFARNEDNPLACGLLVVDEASMMDTLLFYHLLKAVPMGATVVLVGDVHQLPSVGPGNVLADIIASGAVPVVELTEIFRQSAESEIICNAHLINKGQVPSLESSKDRLSDFYFIHQNDPERAADMVVDLVRNHIPRRFGLDPVNDIQVLTPMHKGAVGAAQLNLRLQASLNPNGLEVRRGERSFRLHDKVMQIRNNYDKDVFNGDVGRIVFLDGKERTLSVRYDDRVVPYDFEELDELTPAYAISIHKSQGSEYPAVVIPLMMQHYVLLQRNLVYTGVTRGKKLVVLVGESRALHMAVKNNKTRTRHTRLALRLQPLT